MHLLRGMMIFADCWTDGLAARYTPLRQIKKRAGKVAEKVQLMDIINKAKGNEYWQLAMYCAAVAAGSRGGEIRNLQLKDIRLDEGKIVVRREIAKNRTQREPRLMALADWGLRNLVLRARALGATEPEHYLLPLNFRKSKHLSGQTKAKWDLTRPMTGWVKSWRKLMEACGMQGFPRHRTGSCRSSHNAGCMANAQMRNCVTLIKRVFSFAGLSCPVSTIHALRAPNGTQLRIPRSST